MRSNLSRALAAALAVGLVLAGVAVAEPPVIVRAGNLILKLNGGVTPRALPRDRLAPIGFHAGGTLTTADGSHPPALTEVVVDVDRDAAVDVGGIPSCRKNQLIAGDTAHVKAACGDAILGEGSTTVEVAFPEQAPIFSTGPLLLFNGGSRGGVTTLFLHTYVSVPAPTAVVATAKVTRENKGPYGLRFVFTIPLVAGGAASVIHSELSAKRFLGPEQHSFLFAKCPDGQLRARGTFRFRDETSIAGTVVRPCQTT